MKRVIVLPLLCIAVVAHGFTKEDLRLLEEEMAKKTAYDATKQERIKNVIGADLPETQKNLLLFEEYKSYNYDTALIYAHHLLDEAALKRDKQAYIAARLKLAFAYLSSGLFKECDDVFESLNPKEMNTANQIEYFITKARLYHDMADYVLGSHGRAYIQIGNQCYKQAIELIDAKDSVVYWNALAQYAMKTDEYTLAIERFKRMVQVASVTDHELAIAYSSMGFLYDCLGEETASDHYWILATIADLRSSTKEAIAMRIVALRLYEDGMSELATRCIYYALEDAQQYGARQRQIAIGQILPIIEQQQIRDLQAQNRRITHLSVLLYSLTGVLVVLLLVLVSRIKEFKKAKQTIDTMNKGLTEANVMKEEYIGLFLCKQSALLEEIEKMQKYVSNPNYVRVRKQKNDFYKQFDEMFLHLFPNFVEQVNALALPEEQIELKKGERLSPELRILALMRLGITQNDQIANVLDHSVNTIYTYKTRARNRTGLTLEQWHQALMSISFDRSDTNTPVA